MQIAIMSLFANMNYITVPKTSAIRHSLPLQPEQGLIREENGNVVGLELVLLEEHLGSSKPLLLVVRLEGLGKGSIYGSPGYGRS